MPPEAVFAPLTTTIAFGKTARKELDCRRSARSRSSWSSSWRWWSSARASCLSSAVRSGAAIASSASSSRASRPTSKASDPPTMTTCAPSPRTAPTTLAGRSKPASPTTPRPLSRRRLTPPRNRIRGNHRERRPHDGRRAPDRASPPDHHLHHRGDARGDRLLHLLPVDHPLLRHLLHRRDQRAEARTDLPGAARRVPHPHQDRHLRRHRAGAAGLAVRAVALHHPGVEPEREALRDPVHPRVDRPVRDGSVRRARHAAEGTRVPARHRWVPAEAGADGRQVPGTRLAHDRRVRDCIRVPGGAGVPAPGAGADDTAAAQVAAACDPDHRDLRRRHHTQSGSLLAVLHGRADVHLLRDVDHPRKDLEAMSPPRRRRDAYRPPRSRSEVLTAVAAAVGVIVVTAALIWFLQPGDKSGSGQPSNSTPLSVPQATLPTESAPAVPPSAGTP